MDPRAITLRNLRGVVLPENCRTSWWASPLTLGISEGIATGHCHRGEERGLFDRTVALKDASLLEMHRPDDTFDVECGAGCALKLGELHEAVVAKIIASCSSPP
jgi:hypothetical protein